MIKKINQGFNTPVGKACLDNLPIEGEHFQEWVDNLVDTLVSVKELAAGLAMNQIWDESEQCEYRIFACFLPEMADPEVFINPVGQGSGATLSGWESCMSFEGKSPRKRKRSKNYTILYTRVDGEENNFKIALSYGRVIQHEMDHLDGKSIYPRGG